MAYRLRITLTNPGSQPKRTVIYGGTVFEVDDHFCRTQNRAATTQTVVTVPPGQSQAVEIDTWCLNRSFSPPNNTPMRPTMLVTSQAYTSQDRVWNDMDQRR